jgi:hypothetical protein
VEANGSGCREGAVTQEASVATTGLAGQASVHWGTQPDIPSALDEWGLCTQETKMQFGPGIRVPPPPPPHVEDVVEGVEVPPALKERRLGGNLKVAAPEGAR